MNGHVVNLDLQTHRTVQEDLLPWFLSGTLHPADQELVRQHLQTCTQCQADLEWQRRLRAGAPEPDPAFDVERAYARLLPQLAPRTPGATLAGWWRRAMDDNSAWLRWTAAAQFAALAVFALLLVRPAPDAAPYRTLGAAVHTEGQLVVMFKPDTSERELRRIVQDSGARLVDGPTVTGAYVLGIAPQQAPLALARLRTETAVTLAQPLAAEGRP
jgi:anti-sigma factor RsiW